MGDLHGDSPKAISLSKPRVARCRRAHRRFGNGSMLGSNGKNDGILRTSEGSKPWGHGRRNIDHQTNALPFENGVRAITPADDKVLTDKTRIGE
jgi:hypothetical protein